MYNDEYSLEAFYRKNIYIHIIPLVLALKPRHTSVCIYIVFVVKLILNQAEATLRLLCLYRIQQVNLQEIRNKIYYQIIINHQFWVSLYFLVIFFYVCVCMCVVSFSL